jgi:YHS domain-containing protein
MRTRAPIDRIPATLTLGRGWALPAVVLGIILAGSYLPAHGVRGLVDILAATVAALGLSAASLAAPRWARSAVLARGGGLALLGLAPLWQAGPQASARRRLAAVAVGAAISGAGVAVTATLLVTVESLTAGHAVLLVAFYANVALLLSNVVPMPAWPGWALLLALLDLRGANEPAVDRAVSIARVVITAEAAAIAALAIGSGDWMLLLLSGLLVFQGWTQTTVAKADDLIGRYLAARQIGHVAREVSVIAAPDEPALAAIARRATEGSVIAVRDGDAVLGAIGPRQAAALPPTAAGARCADVMIPIDRLELLRLAAPAISALAQLDRFGFALVLDAGRLRAVETDDVLHRILLTAAVAQAVRANDRSGGAAAGTPHTRRRGIPMTIDSLVQIDPVCGMAVEAPGGIALLHEGREYRFCDVACRDTFQDDPPRWAEPVRHVDEAVPR